MCDELEYMPTADPALLTREELARHAVNAAEGDRVAADETKPMSVRQAAQLKATEAKTRLAIDAKARSAIKNGKAPTSTEFAKQATHTPCGLRPTVTNQPVVNEEPAFLEPVPYWR